ncbi:MULTISPECIES: hypothetical protein [Lachnospiraceae]|nr:MULTISPECIES: hypothetical protein [Enterocloster]MCD7991332.1 hypothetical protein [Clostridia bacterium]
MIAFGVLIVMIIGTKK